MPKPTILTKEDISEIIKLYKSGLSTRKMEEFCKVKRSRISTILKENNIPRKSTGNPYRLRKYTLDEKIFQKIDTEEKAYWLGFIIADGHVSDDGLTIRLSKKDKNHLEKFLKFINSNSSIKYYDRTKSNVINVYSYILVESLRKLGLEKNKSKSAIFPKIRKNLVKHIIRGLIDGDGCISVTKNNYKKGINPCFSLSICGTKNIVDEMINKICNNIGCSRNKIKEILPGFFVTGWGGNKNTFKILDWIYSEANIFLDRKYDRYLQLKNINDIRCNGA